jgi:flagellar biosynthesis/type III secretory pathway protein FliH
MSGATLDFDIISSLEENAYKEGFADGESHGKLHGTFEGRQLGAEKGFELWQELGQMEAFARTWLQLNTYDEVDISRKQQKAIQHLQSVLALIDTMPMENDEKVDIGATMERIRAKHKMACLALSINSDLSNVTIDKSSSATDSQGATSSNIIIKGRQVDSSQLHF